MSKQLCYYTTPVNMLFHCSYVILCVITVLLQLNYSLVRDTSCKVLKYVQLIFSFALQLSHPFGLIVAFTIRDAEVVEGKRNTCV